MAAKEALTGIGNMEPEASSEMESIGGYMWLIIDVLLVAALAGALLWGTHQWRQRRREQSDRSDSEAEKEAVERVYREDERGG